MLSLQEVSFLFPRNPCFVAELTRDTSRRKVKWYARDPPTFISPTDVLAMSDMTGKPLQ